MPSNLKPKSRQNDVVVQEVKGEILIYDLNANRASCLNETSALIWQLCDGTKSVSEISRELSKKFNSPVSEDFVWLAIDQLKEENLLANSNEVTGAFEGMNRREVIKKVGFASMIALPIISGLVAPSAANAASPAASACPGTGPGGFVATCSSNADCGSLNGAPLCCRLLAAGERRCIVASTAGNQCAC